MSLCAWFPANICILCAHGKVCVCVCVCFINNTLFVHLVHLFTLVSVSWSDFPWSRRWTAQASKFCCLAFVAWFWCFVLHFFFFFVFWQAYGIYRIQTSKKKKKKKRQRYWWSKYSSLLVFYGMASQSRTTRKHQCTSWSTPNSNNYRFAKKKW